MDEFRPYALVTLHLDRFGNLEMWQGDLIAFGKREADVYLQLSQDIEPVLEALVPHQRTSVEDGWHQETYYVSEEYFPEGE